MQIDLADRIENSQFFRWKEALYLPKWDIYAHPPDDLIYGGIIKTAFKMDQLRNFFGVPLTIHSWYRPRKYNELIGGASQSAHIEGIAVDFMVLDMVSDEAREILKFKLSEFEIRMENLPTPHIHVDLRNHPEWTNEQRYFRP